MPPTPVPVGSDAPIMEVMATLRAIRRLRGNFGPVRRRPAAEVIHRDQW